MSDLERLAPSAGEKKSPSTAEGHAAQSPILFFDGVCGLCNRTVDWILVRDEAGVVQLAPLQGETAQQLLPPDERQSLDSVILLDAAGRHRRSRAIVRVLRHLGGRYRLYSWLLWLVPAPVREGGYKAIAAIRYRVFGKRESCRMPTPDEQGRLLP